MYNAAEDFVFVSDYFMIKHATLYTVPIISHILLKKNEKEI